MPEQRTATRRAESLPDGYRMTELGPLPEEWRVVRLGKIVSISRKPRKMSWPDTIPFIPMEAIPDDGSLYPSIIEYRSIRDIRSGVYSEGGDILFAKITPSLENGKQAIVPPEIGLAYATTEVYPLKAKRDEIDSFYLFVLLRAPWVRTHLAEKMEGSTGRQRLAKQVLLNFPIPLPPLPEQRAIAHVLRTVQEAREATERVIAALRDLKRSLMRHLFTYGPVPVGATHASPLQDTEIGPIPAHWRVVRLGEVADFKNGINFKREDRGKGILTIDVLNMYTDDIYPRLSGLYRVNIAVRPDHLLAPGDLLFVRSSLKQEGVGWTAIFPGYHEPVTFCGFLIRGRLHSKDVLPEFMVNFLRLPPVRELMVSKSGKVAITNINQGNLKAIPIPVPPLEEQRQIARILQTVDRKIEAEEARRQALDDLFRSLLHHLMTAKIRLPADFIAQFEEVTSS